MQRLEGSDNWLAIQDEFKYMLKYVAEKLSSKDPENRQCFHYRFNDEKRQENGIAAREEWYSTEPHSFGKGKKAFRFRLEAIDLFCFMTGICIVSMRVHFEKSDSLWISSAQYHLKKVSRERISRESAQQSDAATLLDIAVRTLSAADRENDFNYFYYANPDTERANVFTYLQVPHKGSYKKELFYLRRCYSDDFTYTENAQLEEEEIYVASKSVIWGISPEAAVCLACTENSDREFITGRFYENFNTQYLFMYVLLLHQKYVLYYFLSNISKDPHSKAYNDLDKLEEYRQKLYEFERDYVFSWVTDVPQYQLLYNRLSQAFALKQMYEDVHEPLISLSELRRETSENLQKKREENMNKILFILSVLGIFSALIDGFDFIAAFFGWFMTDLGVHILQVSLIIIIVLIGVYVFGILIKHNKDK